MWHTEGEPNSVTCPTPRVSGLVSAPDESAEQECNRPDQLRQCRYHCYSDLGFLLPIQTRPPHSRLKAVVTQNIDGLHQAAGSKRVLELHGNWTRLECTGCGARSTIDDFDEARAGRVPHCPSCSAVVRPDIVFYGEALDPATLEGAVLAIAGADMLIVGGTSLAVYPAAGLIDYYQGGRLVLMNATPTPYDGRADLIIREPIGRVFAQIQGHV